MNDILKFENVSKIYKVNETITKAIDEVNVSIQEGDIVVVLGPSGSGKSTLLNLLSGIDHCTKGKIFFNDSQIQDFNDEQLGAFRRQNLGFIFQTYNLISNLNVSENVELGKQLALHSMDMDEIIEAVGLKEMKDRFPYQLSGGQQQRVSIARALVKNPKILFCDEPTGALDEETGKSILQIIQDINQKYGTTVIIITHNPSIAMMANQVIYLNSGKIVKNICNLDVKKASDIQWA
jgi:putative ABC transport system ATP-binding protein